MGVGYAADTAQRRMVGYTACSGKAHYHRRATRATAPFWSVEVVREPAKRLLLEWNVGGYFARGKGVRQLSEVARAFWDVEVYASHLQGSVTILGLECRLHS